MLPPTSSDRTSQGPWQRQVRGFTAIELLVVIAILGVLAALAAPSFRPIIEKWRIQQAVEEMTSTLYFARAEAMKRGGRIRVQKTASGDGCTASTNQEWSCGWFVYIDANGNNSFDSASDTLLQSYPRVTNVDITHQSGGAGFNVDRWGMANGLNAAGFSFTPKSGSISSPSARGICVSSGGRVRTITDPPCS